jgi:Peptidase family M28
MLLTPIQGFWARAAAALAVLLMAVVFGFAWTSPPPAAPRDAPAAEFSSARARAHLEVIARRPRRIGSPEHARTRAYLVDQLTALGLAPAVQEATSVRPGEAQPLSYANVKNVVARRKGTGSEKALLLVAHYDSRSMTPGASDDGYGVAALLETARALTAGAPLVSDVIFLFSDGEEEGLLGASLFATHHPWAADVGLVLNFDARGNTGPALMYQTGDENGALIRELARAAPDPVGSSIAQAVYKHMPNDSDLSVWLPATPSLNFANIGGVERYHAPTDTVENVDEGTLQHHGSYALSLARAFGEHTLPLPRTADATYFNAGPFFVHYSGVYDQPLALGAALLVVAFLALGHRHGSVRAPFVALGVAVIVGLAAVAAAGCAVLGVLAAAVHLHYFRLAPAVSPGVKGFYLASFVALTVALGLVVQARVARFVHAAELFAGSAAILAVLALVAPAYLPGASCLFVWPILLTMPVAIGLTHIGAIDHDDPQAITGALAMSCPAIVLFAPLIPLLFSVFGPGAAPVLGAVTALLFATAAPAVRLLLRPVARLAPQAALGIGALCYLAATVHPRFGRDYPQPDTLVYALDADKEKAFWLSPDLAPDAWTGPALAGATEERTAPLPLRIEEHLFVAPTAAVKEPGPGVVWLSDTPSGSGRAIHLRVVPPAGAEMLSVHVEGLHAAHVAGLEAPLQSGALAFRFYAPPADGVEMEIITASTAPAVVRVASQRPGFPADASPAPGPRPADLGARPGMMGSREPLLETDMTIVARAARKE